MSAAQHLAQYGVSVGEARDFILSHLSSPGVIYQTALQFGVTATMLAEIYGSVTANDVVAFFDAQGMNGAALDSDSNDNSLPSDGTFLLDFEIGSSGSDQLTVGTGPLPYASVAMGMEGDDQLTSLTNTGSILLGGSGNDSYAVGANGRHVVLDSGGTDHLYIPSTFDSLEAELFNSGQDLVLSDGNLVVLMPDWQQSANRIESFSLSGTSYSYNDLVSAVQTYGNDITNLVSFYSGLTADQIDQHLALFDYLSEVEQQNFDQQVTFDTSQTVGSTPLIDYLML